MLYKVGQRVKISPKIRHGINPRTERTRWHMCSIDKITGEIIYDEVGDSVISSMREFAGQIATITHAGVKYLIDLDEGELNWTDEMFLLSYSENEEFE